MASRCPRRTASTGTSSTTNYRAWFEEFVPSVLGQPRVSTNFRGTLSFPESIVSRFTCEELRPDFYVAAGRLPSIAIGEGGENVVLPCPLQPGPDPYRIVLTSGGEGAGGRSMGGNPQRSLDATLIVE